LLLQDCSQTSSQHAVSAVTPQRAIINIASAGSVLQRTEQRVQTWYTLMMLASFGAARVITDQQSA
jgi:hypothetical protein